jgi:hypothetical protein
MTHIEQAIKDAIGGGWKGPTARSENFSHQSLISAWGHGLAALDAAFWQALGKARGRQDEPSMCKDCRTIGTGDGNHMKHRKVRDRAGGIMKNWPRLIDHLADGHSAEQFFEILKMKLRSAMELAFCLVVIG